MTRFVLKTLSAFVKTKFNAKRRRAAVLRTTAVNNDPASSPSPPNPALFLPSAVALLTVCRLNSTLHFLPYPGTTCSNVHITPLCSMHGIIIFCDASIPVLIPPLSGCLCFVVGDFNHAPDYSLLIFGLANLHLIPTGVKCNFRDCNHQSSRSLTSDWTYRLVPLSIPYILQNERDPAIWPGFKDLYLLYLIGFHLITHSYERLRVDAKRACPLRFGTMNHAKTKLD